MADRVINANILKGKPTINFASNNIINNIDYDEAKVTIDNSAQLFSINDSYLVYTVNSSGVETLVSTNPHNYNILRKNFSNFFTLQYLVIPVFLNVNSKSVKVCKGSSTDEKGVTSKFHLDKVNRILVDDDELLQMANAYIYLNKLSGYIYLMVVSPELGSPDVKYLTVRNYELNINGEKYLINTTNKSYPQSVKSNFALSANELMQADTTINGVSIGQHIANDIVEKYKNGKATMKCDVYVGNDTPLFVVGEIAKVYGFDGKSVSRNRDGTDKRFKITSAEWRWAGQEMQNLEMVEV